MDAHAPTGRHSGVVPQEAVWNQPISVTNSEGNFRSPYMVGDARGRLHAFWSQAESTNLDGPSKTIHYARWEAGQWSQPKSVLASPDGKADQPAAAISTDNRLYSVWSGGEGGQIYFSQANADQAVVAESWESPQPLPSRQSAGSAPSIVINQDGVISVADELERLQGGVLSAGAGAARAAAGERHHRERGRGFVGDSGRVLYRIELPKRESRARGARRSEALQAGGRP